jgi:hypothetical protein
MNPFFALILSALVHNVVARIDKNDIPRQGLAVVADEEARDSPHIVHGYESVLRGFPLGQFQQFVELSDP